MTEIDTIDAELDAAAALADARERDADEIRAGIAEDLAGRELEMPDPASSYFPSGYARVVAACRLACPGVIITCDSARIPAIVGWGKDKKTPRLYTRHRAALIAEGRLHETGAVCEEATRRSFTDETRERETAIRAAGWFDRELFESWEESQRASGLSSADGTQFLMFAKGA